MMRKFILALPLLLCACATKTATETIADGIVKSNTAAIEIIKETETLEMCKATAVAQLESSSSQTISMKETHATELALEESKTLIWQMVAIALFLFIMYRIFKRV